MCAVVTAMASAVVREDPSTGGLPRVEEGVGSGGLRVLRLVVDGIQECNLRCLYCHPGKVWVQQRLASERIAEVFTAAERYGCLEVVLTGGEITLHPELGQILEATHLLRRTGSTLITNATRITPETVAAMGASNLTRICVSVDGTDNQTHGSARGKNLARVLDGLRRLQVVGCGITVISVVHQGNFRRIGELSRLLANEGLASQHHLCAPSFSGLAREHYPELKLGWDDFFAVQATVDQLHAELAAKGLYVAFNSFWPATGQRPLVVNGGRTMTLQQVSEQVKDSLVNVRPNGEFRLNAATWGREMVGNAVIGNVHDHDPLVLLGEADRRLGDGSVGQLPREVEARHKFQVGPGADERVTNALLDPNTPSPRVQLVPIKPLSQHWLFANSLEAGELAALAACVRRSPTGFRLVRHASGVVLVFDKGRSHLTLLTADEWNAFAAGLTRVDSSTTTLCGDGH